MSAVNRVVSFKAGDHLYHLRFQHKDLRDACVAADKTIGELYDDKFRGWPYLIAFGIRWKHDKITLDDACKIIDRWLDDGNEFGELGFKLLDALKASGYIRVEKAEEESAGDSGKAQSLDTPAL